MSIVGTNNMLRRTELANDPKDGLHRSFKRTSSGLNVGQNTLCPVTEIENETPAFTSNKPNNTSKLAAVKKRSYAVNALYKNVMNKRNSTAICTIEHNNTSKDLGSRTTSNGRPPSMANLTSSICVTVNNSDRQNQKFRNPIDHYEQNMNFALRPKRSSTADFVDTEQPHVQERSESSTNLNTVGNRDLHRALTETHILHHDGGDRDSDRNQSLPNRDLISGEIANALRDDILHREITFDNKWVDNTTFDNFAADHVSQISSNQSPLTKIPGCHQNLSNISRRDSLILEDFEKDLRASISTHRSSSNEKPLENSSRLQLKLNTLKMKYESLHENCCYSDTPNSENLADDTTGRNPAKLQERYWNMNIDVKTKIESEKVSRELQLVRRTAADDKSFNGRFVLSRLKQIMKDRCLTEKNETTRTANTDFAPVLTTVNSSHSDVAFTKFFESTKKDRSENDQFQEKISQTLIDENLKESLFHGRDYTSKMWLEIEKFEFS